MAAGQASYTRHLNPFDASFLAIVPHGARSEQAGAGGVTGVGEGAEYTFFQGGEDHR